MNRESLLMEITELDFARYDLRLFLNTHPSDRQAIADYNSLTMDVDRLRAEFEGQYGPLSHSDMSDENCFMWIDDPWPWERAFMEKGER